ncbi:hypothetical protein GUJ93_ZPchr0001g31687 [Zizania palustris]|uniref:Uncharacterized protein n=1 Tax=Zizania palustris TaxID=103762 RepID=A0A8J5RS13_ZIZPA|nr:hypothetical protein GUJ93_ZPchr0001g31687 [Zizania palustris]
MMRKIGYLLQPEFEGIEFVVGADHSWKVDSFWALLDLRHAHDEKLWTTAFRCHPARQEGESFSLFYNTKHEEDTTIVHMARMMESMDDMYTMQEHESRKEIEAQGEKLRCLEKEIQLARGRLRSGSGGSSTFSPRFIPGRGPGLPHARVCLF